MDGLNPNRQKPTASACKLLLRFEEIVPSRMRVASRTEHMVIALWPCCLHQVASARPRVSSLRWGRGCQEQRGAERITCAFQIRAPAGRNIAVKKPILDPVL